MDKPKSHFGIVQNSSEPFVGYQGMWYRQSYKVEIDPQ